VAASSSVRPAIWSTVSSMPSEADGSATQSSSWPTTPSRSAADSVGVEGNAAGTSPGMMPVRGPTRGKDIPAAHLAGTSGVQLGSGNLQFNYFYGDSPAAGSDGMQLAAAPGITSPPSQSHAFISYVREDSGEADALQKLLEAAEVPVWRDTSSLWPGEDWRSKIRSAISRDALVFIACFSSHSAARRKSYQNEELLLAVDQLRQRQPDDPWLIPVRFDDCDVPDYELGAGRTLASLQRVDLFGANRQLGARRLEKPSNGSCGLAEVIPSAWRYRPQRLELCGY
jgi:TIR domain